MYLDNPSRAKLEEILKDKKCFVCGTEFTEKDAPYHYITERLKLQEEYLKEWKNMSTTCNYLNSLICLLARFKTIQTPCSFPCQRLISSGKIVKKSLKNTWFNVCKKRMKSTSWTNRLKKSKRNMV